MAALPDLKRWFRWLFEPRLLWAGASLLTATLVVLFYVHPLQEPVIRWWGMALEFLGILTVVNELRSTQSHFKKPGLRQHLKAWLARRPSRNVTIALTGVSGGGTLGHVTVSASGHVHDANATLEQRVASLEANVININVAMTKAQSALNTEKVERAAGDAREAEARAHAVKAIESRIEEVTAGSIHVSLFGIGCLAVGLLLGTGSQELAKWLMVLLGPGAAATPVAQAATAVASAPMPSTSAATGALAFMPLWQSVAGAVGAFLVAAFTVWVTNSYTRRREEKQAQRAIIAERRKVLREKLDALVAACEAAYRIKLGTAQYALRLAASIGGNQAKPESPSHGHDADPDMSAPIVAATLYFPTLLDHVYAVHVEHRELLAAVQAKILADVASGTPLPIVLSEEIMFKAKAAKFALLAEARKIIERDFDLKE